MADPVVASAVTEAFVPLLIINNKGGKDAEVLKRFNEPSRNYQVIRFLNSDGNDIIPRRDKVWTKSALTSRMLTALAKAGRTPPAYLQLEADAQDTRAHRKIALAMYCFWTGEMRLGQIPGVIETEAGWFDGREVTLVTYHSGRIKTDELIRKASALDCAQRVYLPSRDMAQVDDTGSITVGKLDNGYRKAKASDQKKQINRLKLPSDLTPAQLTKLNAWYRVDREKALKFLTQDQRKGL